MPVDFQRSVGVMLPKNQLMEDGDQMKRILALGNGKVGSTWCQSAYGEIIV